jgi:hypothetical protein
MFPTSYQCVTGLLILDYGYVNFIADKLQGTHTHPDKEMANRGRH